jgi:hypothetical protein
MADAPLAQRSRPPNANAAMRLCLWYFMLNLLIRERSDPIGRLSHKFAPGWRMCRKLLCGKAAATICDNFNAVPMLRSIRRGRRSRGRGKVAEDVLCGTFDAVWPDFKRLALRYCIELGGPSFHRIGLQG